MTKKFEYETYLVKGPQNGIFAEFPFDSVKEFNSKKPVRVNVTFDGKPWSMSLLPNGKGGHWLHVKKEIRDCLSKHEGDKILITLEEDTSPKTVQIPEYLQWLLDNDLEMAAWYKKMPFSTKKFWIGFIEEARNNDTKVDRINRLFDFLKHHYSGKK